MREVSDKLVTFGGFAMLCQTHSGLGVASSMALMRLSYEYKDSREHIDWDLGRLGLFSSYL